MAKRDKYIYFDRELSWLSFNGRVLQEAKDPTVPLFERLSFLAIFSSNLDEFFRVRVASLRSLLRLKKKSIDNLDFNPSKLLKQIYRVVTGQQEEFGRIFREEILPELEALGIRLINDQDVKEEQAEFVRKYFDEQVRPHVRPYFLDDEHDVPFLPDKCLFLLTALRAWPVNGSEDRRGLSYGVVEVPRTVLPRFVWIPGTGEHQYVMFLDDIVRFNLPQIFPEYEIGQAYAVKLSRDADLNLDDEYTGNLKEKIAKGLAKRASGIPCRVLYDLNMPVEMVSVLTSRMRFDEDDLVPGGRYHNLHDLHSFPRFGFKDLCYAPLPPLGHPVISGYPSLFSAIKEQDLLLHLPYQSFDYVVDFLHEATDDPEVEEIWIALYRVASQSKVVSALIEAARKGKRVTAFVEIKARFDEEPNLFWAEQMEQAGIRILYSMPGLKVHAKLALVVRSPGADPPMLAYLSTGNFNEKTARIYTDEGLFTADQTITRDIRKVFGFLSGEIEKPSFERVLVAPFYLRKSLYRLIDREIEHAQSGREARIILKMNSLEDTKIITRLYEASNAGVRVDLVVRGICRLVPGVKGQSENIRVRSIVDRFLEHSRVFIFYNDGAEEYYLASADWMRRNLSERVEVAFPILDDRLKQEIRKLVELHLADNTKARIIDEEQTNQYIRDDQAPPVRAQLDTYSLLKKESDEISGSTENVYLQSKRDTEEREPAAAASDRQSPDIPQFLGEHEPFRSLSRDELETISRLLETVRYEAGDVVVSSDRPSSALFVVREGELVVEGPEQPVRRFGTGDVFNGASVFVDASPVASVRVVRGCTLFRLDSRYLDEGSPITAKTIVKVIRELARDSLRHYARETQGY